MQTRNWADANKVYYILEKNQQPPNFCASTLFSWISNNVISQIWNGQKYIPKEPFS